MNFLSLKYKKIIATVFIVVLVIPFGVSIKPQKAEAYALIVATNIVDDFKEWLLDGALGWTIVNMLIAQIGNNIINWINSGFEGDPTFVSNPRDFFLGVANEATGAVIRETVAGQLFCAPYRPQILIALSQTNTYSQRAQCTLLDVVDNVDGFLNDFSQGGWDGWIQLTQNPQGNIYGSYLIAVDEKNRRISQATGYAKNEISQGQGFISLKRCKKGTELLGPDVTNSEADLLGPDIADTPPKGKCAESDKEVVTPGQIIVGQLNDTLGAPLARLGQADEITEAVLSGIMNALVNQLVLGGLRSLSSGGGGSGTNLYLDASNQDKDELLKTIDATIEENTSISTSNETIINLLAKISETQACYSKQRVTIANPEFHPPNTFIVPADTNIIERQRILTKNTREIEERISGTRSEVANGQIGKLFELRDRIVLASEKGLINPSSLAEFWKEYSEIRRSIDLQERGQEIQVVKNTKNQLEDITLELDICTAKLDQLNSFVGAEVPAIDVNCIEGCKGLQQQQQE